MYELEDPQAPTKPRLSYPLKDDPTFVYYNSASTDVTRTWRKFGWKPLSEKQNENA
jgi:hypothetical protein